MKIIFAIVLVLAGTAVSFSQIQKVEWGSSDSKSLLVKNLQPNNFVVGFFDADNIPDTVIAVAKKNGNSGVIIRNSSYGEIVIGAGNYTSVNVKYGKKINDPTEIYTVDYDTIHVISNAELSIKSSDKRSILYSIQTNYKALRIAPTGGVLVLPYLDKLMCFCLMEDGLYMTEIYYSPEEME